MKKIIYCIIIILLFTPYIYSQINWTTQYSGTYENLNGVYFVDNNTGYAVGNNGKVLKTINASSNWTSLSFPVITKNNCVYFLNAQTGFVGNDDWNLYKTINGGNSWTPILTGANFAITSIYFSSPSIAYVGDHYGNIIKSTNGGDNWFTLLNMPGYDAKVFFNNDLRGWGVDTYGYVAITTNSGASFTLSHPSNDTLASIYFVSSTLGFIAGDSGRVYKSINGGVNWTLLNTGLTEKFKSVYAQTPNILFASGNSGLIIYSIDGGNTWATGNYSTSNLNCMYFMPGTLNGTVVGDLGTILSTTNQGVSCIGSGTTQVGYPFYTYYEDSRTDMLFLSSELLANGIVPGVISKIGFNVAISNAMMMSGFNIKIQNSALTSLSGFTNDGWFTAYSGTYTVPGTGLQFINLTSPYYWDGSGNLLIEICYNNSSFINNSFVYSSPAPNMTVHQHQDLPTGDGCMDITAGVVQANRPNVCFVSTVISGVHNNNIPVKFQLSQNYPNPFNPVTSIKYQIPKNSFVKLIIFDILGKTVSTLVNQQQNAGSYIVDWNGSQYSSGVYFYKLETENFSDVKRMMLVK